jgi:membrane-bound metal-dependent hydrolase YbcI (DUF457 family)
MRDNAAFRIHSATSKTVLEASGMPLLLGHAALGLTTQDLCSRDHSTLNRWPVAVFVIVLANLPDVDILIGLLLRGNGHAFHRGPTHSLLFALFMGLVASRAWTLWSKIPKMNVTCCVLILLSHVLADLVLTSSPVSLFWPLEVYWTAGYSGWGDVISTVFVEAFQDAGIIMGCGGVILFNRLIRRHPLTGGKGGLVLHGDS